MYKNQSYFLISRIRFLIIKELDWFLISRIRLIDIKNSEIIFDIKNYFDINKSIYWYKKLLCQKLLNK